jgi:hypothetical protein
MFLMKTRLSIVRFQNCDPDRVFQIVSQSRSRKRPAVVIALSKDCVFHNLGRFLPGIGTRRSSYRNHQGCSLWDPTGSGSSVFLSEHFNCHMFIVMNTASIIGYEFYIHLNCYRQTAVAMRIWTRVIRVRSHPTCNRGMTFVIATSRLLAISSYLYIKLFPFLNSSLIIFYLMFWIGMKCVFFLL